MKLTLSSTYDVPPEEIFAIISDTTFREQACEATRALSHQVTVTEAADDTVVRVRREMPSTDIPDIARRFVGDTLTLVQTETWHPAAADGTRHAEVRGEVPGTPVSLRGTASIVPAGAGGTHSIELDIKVAVPLVGRKIEPFVVEAVRRGLEKEHELGRSWPSDRL